MLSDEQAAQRRLVEDLVRLNGLVLVYDKLTAKLAEYDELLESACTEMASFKEQVRCIGMEKEGSKRVVAEVREKLKQRMMHLNVMYAGNDRQRHWRAP